MWQAAVIVIVVVVLHVLLLLVDLAHGDDHVLELDDLGLEHGVLIAHVKHSGLSRIYLHIYMLFALSCCEPVLTHSSPILTSKLLFTVFLKIRG